MKHEIDFIGLQEQTKDALAVCLRYYDTAKQDYVTVVYDGGTQKYGTELVSILRKFYSNGNTPIVDLVICSHDHDDHASGLRVILEECQVKKLIMNRPWLYTDELMDFVDDGRKTKESVEKILREKYCYINELEQIAEKKNIIIQAGFCGVVEPNMPFHILSPSKDFYVTKILDSRKTPCNTPESDNLQKSSNLQSFSDTIKMKTENWLNYSLKEEVQTEPDNETSIILHCDFEEKKSYLQVMQGKKL